MPICNWQIRGHFAIVRPMRVSPYKNVWRIKVDFIYFGTKNPYFIGIWNKKFCCELIFKKVFHCC